MSTVALRSIKEREILTRKSQRVRCMNLTPSVSIGLKAGKLKIRSVSFAAICQIIENDDEEDDHTHDITGRCRWHPAAANNPRGVSHMQNHRHRCARWCRLLRAPDVASESPWVRAWEENNGWSWCL